MQGTIMQYIDEMDEDVTIDSDFVLKKALERAIHQSYYAGEKEVTLRLIIFCPILQQQQQLLTNNSAAASNNFLE